VNVQVSGFVARVVVTQEFENPLDEPIEALYTFPLSERAAVDAMEMRTDGRTIRGTIRRREEARRIYEAAKAAGQLAGLLDEERPNVFTQTVANLMPGATVRVRIEYVEPLPFADGRFEFSFPTVVGPRFVPPGVVDAARITPPVTPKGTRAGHDISIRVDVDAGVPIEAVESPLQQIDVRRDGSHRARVRLRRGREIPNRDFVLRYRVAGEGVRSTHLLHRPDGEGDGYVTFVLVPPARVTAETAAPKEMIFVIDRSGSQMGAPQQTAKETMHWNLDHLHPRDTYQVLSFSNTTETLFDRPRPASPEMIRQARAHIDALEANGGTMMADAVARVCATPADDNRLRIVTFMTDGYVGNDFEVLGMVRRLRGASRWFPFGTGNATNRFLLGHMARLGGGETEHVLLGEPGDVVAGKFWERIGSPVLTDVRVDFEGLDVVDVYPTAPADVWAERPLVIHARYRGAGHGRVVLRGFQGGRPYEQALDVTLPARHAANAAIASMWARAKVEALMDRDLQALQSGTYPAPLREEIVRVALAHRILTPFTSFVAVEDRVVNEGGTSRTVQVPVEMPDGVEYEGIFGNDVMQEAAAAPAAASVTGRVRMASKAARQGFRALDAAEPATIERRDADEPTLELDDCSVRKLGPALRVLVEQGPEARGAAPTQDGWARVRVRLRTLTAETRRALEEAGLVVQSSEGTSVTGLATPAVLQALVRLEAVVRIETVP
jgi:Ca-activated chloride channel family protein